jgi:hypothetical protein
LSQYNGDRPYPSPVHIGQRQRAHRGDAIEVDQRDDVALGRIPHRLIQEVQKPDSKINYINYMYTKNKINDRQRGIDSDSGGQ